MTQSPDNKIFLKPYQLEASTRGRDIIKDNIFKPRPKGAIWVCPARTGKTYSTGWALKEALADIPHDPHRYCDVLWLTRKSLKIQAMRVLAQAGLSSRSVVESSQAITSSVGEQLFISWETRLVNSEIDYIPIWNDETKPLVIVLDECQDVKNPATSLAKVISSAIEQGILVLFASATPFTKLSETKVVLMGLGLCNAHNWKSTVMHFAEGSSIEEFSPAAMARLNAYLVDRGLKLEFKNIKFDHRCFNKVRVVEFESQKHQDFYNEAYSRYLEEIRKHNKHEPQGVRAIWVAMQKFRHAAEMIRSGLLAKVSYDAVTLLKKQSIIIVSYLDTQDLIIDTLINRYKVPQSKISVIRGGLNNRALQREVDRFQHSLADYCIVSGKSGGAGLDLSHIFDEARPRYLALPPTWSAIDLVQWLGRAHGPCSLSTTYQDTIWYKDTIEEKVAGKVQIKLRSLKEIVDKRETWVDLFSQLTEEDAKDLANQMIAEDLKEQTDEDGNIFIDTLAVEALAEE